MFLTVEKCKICVIITGDAFFPYGGYECEKENLDSGAEKTG